MLQFLHVLHLPMHDAVLEDSIPTIFLVKLFWCDKKSKNTFKFAIKFELEIVHRNFLNFIFNLPFDFDLKTKCLRVFQQ